ncbi:MAG: TetR/AcrR family transcriptional regulator [Nakamurella sp.]
MVKPGAAETRQEQLTRRHGRIVSAAREMAETSGWDGVTTRRLADAIGYSQPVLYGHFPQGKAEIMAAVAQVGFVEMAALMSGDGAVEQHGDHVDLLRRVVEGYLAFAAQSPATYDAMFSLPTELLFADPESPHELRAGFDVLVLAIGGDPAAPRPEDGLSAELLWSALHGMAMLERGGRVRTQDRTGRLEGVLELFRTRSR